VPHEPAYLPLRLLSYPAAAYHFFASSVKLFFIPEELTEMGVYLEITGSDGE